MVQKTLQMNLLEPISVRGAVQSRKTSMITSSITMRMGRRRGIESELQYFTVTTFRDQAWSITLAQHRSPSGIERKALNQEDPPELVRWMQRLSHACQARVDCRANRLIGIQQFQALSV